MLPVSKKTKANVEAQAKRELSTLIEENSFKKTIDEKRKLTTEIEIGKVVGNYKLV